MPKIKGRLKCFQLLLHSLNILFLSRTKKMIEDIKIEAVRLGSEEAGKLIIP